jgi:hypothetical protein
MKNFIGLSSSVLFLLFEEVPHLKFSRKSRNQKISHNLSNEEDCSVNLFIQNSHHSEGKCECEWKDKDA